MPVIRCPQNWAVMIIFLWNPLWTFYDIKMSWIILSCAGHFKITDFIMKILRMLNVRIKNEDLTGDHFSTVVYIQCLISMSVFCSFFMSFRKKYKNKLYLIFKVPLHTNILFYNVTALLHRTQLLFNRYTLYIIITYCLL